MDSIQAFIQTYFADFMEYEFLQRMVLGTVLVSVTCSLLSVFVVLKKMAFIGQGISHSAFGGIALGMLIFPTLASPNWAVYLITLGFSITVALLIGFASRTKHMSEDSAIGIFFASSMALGVIFLSMRENYMSDMFNYLFGSITSITQNDIYFLSGLAIIVIVSVLFLFKEYYVYCYDETYADTLGVPTGFLHYWLLFLLSITIVLSAKIVGVILVTAFLVIPGACAQQMTWRFGKMVVLSLIIGLVSSLCGIYVSSRYDVPPGAMIVAIQFVFFVFLLACLRGKALFARG